jgi:hypothetical protein
LDGLIFLGFWLICPVLLGGLIGVALARRLRRTRRRSVRYVGTVICSLILLVAIPMPLVRLLGSFSYDRPREMGLSEFVILFGASIFFAALTASAMVLSAFVAVRRSTTK